MCLFFFFKQKTAYEMRISDWSSDVCSSDLSQLDRTRKNADDYVSNGADERDPRFQTDPIGRQGRHAGDRRKRADRGLRSHPSADVARTDDHADLRRAADRGGASETN